MNVRETDAAGAEGAKVRVRASSDDDDGAAAGNYSEAPRSSAGQRAGGLTAVAGFGKVSGQTVTAPECDDHSYNFCSRSIPGSPS